MEESLMVDEIFPFHNFKYPTEKKKKKRESEQQASTNKNKIALKNNK